QLGGLLSMELLCYAHALKKTGITEAMVFSTVNGVIATLIGWRVFGQRISALTRWACLFTLPGACLVWSTSLTNWQGDLTAFVSGMCLTSSSFQLEQLLTDARQGQETIQLVMGVQFLTVALLTLLIALCFGQWESVQALLPSDLAALVYASFAAILLPCFLMLIVQCSLSAITVAFFSVVELLTCAAFAFFSAGERLPILAYIGVGIVIVGDSASGSRRNPSISLPGGWIREYSLCDLEKGCQGMLSHGPAIHDVKDAPAINHKRIRNQGTVTTPGESLSTHDDGALSASEFLKFDQTCAKGGCGHIIRVATKGGIAPTGI
ncbi:MAG TPA: DMT family transporter, partial [Ktedonobacteraceae bacterium]|nr:DMT family transporter [Ktedonobacteraceae bacterium]